MQGERVPTLDSNSGTAELLAGLEFSIEHIAPEAFGRKSTPPDERVAAAGAVARTAADHSLAASQYTSQIIVAIENVRTESETTPSLSAGQRQQIQRHLCAALRNVGAATPTALYDHVPELLRLLEDGTFEMRTVAAELVVSGAGEYPARFEQTEAVLDASLNDDVRLTQRHGADIASNLIGEWTDQVCAFLPRLIELLEVDDDAVRRRAANAIHEISIEEPGLVGEYTETLAGYLRDRNDRVRALTMLVFIELVPVDGVDVWAYGEDIKRNFTLDDENARTNVELLLARLSIRDPEALSSHVDIIETALESGGSETLTFPVKQVANMYPDAAVKVYDTLVKAVGNEEQDPNTRADFAVAAHWIADSTGESPRVATLQEQRDLLASEHAVVRAAMALFYLTLYDIDPKTVESVLQADQDDERDLVDVVWIDSETIQDRDTAAILERVQSEAETQSGAVDTTPPEPDYWVEPSYKHVREDNASTVIERAVESFHRDDRTVLAELGEVVSVLHSNSRAIQHMAIRVFALASRYHPQQVSRYLDEIIPLVTSLDPQVRRHALRSVLVLVDSNPKKVIEHPEPFLECLSYDDRLTRQPAAQILIEISSRDASPLTSEVDRLVDAIETKHVFSSFAVELTLDNVAAIDVQSLRPYTKQMLSKLQLDIRINPGTVEQVESTIEMGRARGDDPSQSLIPIDFLLDDQNRIATRPMLTALGSLFMFDSSMVVTYSDEVRELLNSDTRNKEYGLWLLYVAATAGEIGVRQFAEDICELLQTDEVLTPTLAEKMGDCLIAVADTVPDVFAPWVNELTTRLIDIERAIEADERRRHLLTALLYLIWQCLDAVEPENYPTSDKFLHFLTYDDEAGRYATNILGQLVNAYPAATHKVRQTIMEWCDADHDTEELVGAVEFMTRTGSVSTLNEHFYTTNGRQ